jgi:Rrf2 family nitric oxide-sensitive transcriptional repressor
MPLCRWLAFYLLTGINSSTFIMKLRLQTDYALRTLIYLAGKVAGAGNDRATADEIAEAFIISKDHLVKIVQQLGRLGLVKTYAGRGGGITLARAADQIKVRHVIESMEGKTRVLECVENPTVCPMEPGCHLRKLLMKAESAFYETLQNVTIADLITGKRKGGLVNLTHLESEPK